ncbi:MAG: class I SAM-dependent methyltransferase [Betaproteobacteria bacterium]|nr:class I SAM-dependent methyltransferase [Betaproteobacteria bacterium]
MTSGMLHAPIRCPYCNAESAHAFSADDWNQRASRQHFDYRACGQCRLIFVQRIPEDLGSYYVNEQYDVPASADGFEPRAESQRWKVDLLTKLVSGGDLFEVGPATGEFAYVARKAGFRPRLAEMDGQCCKFLREKLKLDVVQTGNPAEALEGDSRYAAICVWQAIEHIPKFWELLDRAVGSLQKGGVMVLSTPNPESLQAKVLGRYWPHIDAPRHLYLIPSDWFVQFARRHGLSVELNTTRDVGSLGLNYYGWYLAVRNFAGGWLGESGVRSVAGRIAGALRKREETEGRGCSYTIAFRKPV